MPRVLRSEAHADALREWTLAEACYSWSRYVASDATSAAGPDDECPCAGAARNEEYLVSCDPVRLTPPSRRTTSRAFPSRPPANVTETFAPSLFARHRHFIPFPSSDAEAERRRDARATAPVPSSPSLRPRPFRRDPHPGNTPPLPPERLLIQEATGYHLPETPSSSPPTPPSDDAFIFFVVAFACIIAACVASLAVVHRWWRREAAPRGGTRRARRRVQPVEHGGGSRRRRRGERQVGETRRERRSRAHVRSVRVESLGKFLLRHRKGGDEHVRREISEGTRRGGRGGDGVGRGGDGRGRLRERARIFGRSVGRGAVSRRRGRGRNGAGRKRGSRAWRASRVGSGRTAGRVETRERRAATRSRRSWFSVAIGNTRTFGGIAEKSEWGSRSPVRRNRPRTSEGYHKTHERQDASRRVISKVVFKKKSS